MSGSLIILLTLITLIVEALALIWSTNTLFPTLQIPYNLETWIAVIMIMGILRNLNKEKE